MVTEQNFFALFGLPPVYQLDLAQLNERYLSLQKTVHPDRFSHQGEREQLRAVQVSAHLNDALATLKSPLKRAAYLLKLKGVDPDGQAATISDPAFLMQQMLLREQLDEAAAAADPLAALDQLLVRVELQAGRLSADLAEALSSDDPEVLAQALEMLRKLQFFDKLRYQIELSEEQLADL